MRRGSIVPFKLNAALFDARIHGEPHDEADSAAFVPKAIVEPADLAAPPRRPAPAWRDLIIYEMHVRGFTRDPSRHPGSRSAAHSPASPIPPPSRI